MPAKRKTVLKRGILLNNIDMKDALEKLPKWRLEDGKLEREYHFKSFIEAFAFLSSVALTSEGIKHYPECWSYNQKVVVRLFSTEPKGISTVDVLMANKLDELASGTAEVHKKA